MSTERVQNLRNKTLINPAVCTERAYWYTESFKQTEGEYHAIRHAKGIANVFEHMTVFIDEGELIVGRLTSKVRGGLLTPEANMKWLLRELDTIHVREWDRYQPLSEEEKQTIREVAAWWDGKSLHDKFLKRLPAETALRNRYTHTSGAFCDVGFHIGHYVVDYPKLISKGIDSIIEEIDGHLAKLNPVIPEEAHKIENYTAWKINLRGILTLARRYSELAAEMAAKETDLQRKAELELISRTCANVPAKPASSFLEAIQAMWFGHILVMVTNPSTGYGIGRMDQYLFPYYDHDIKNGVITRDQAVELLALLNIRMNQTNFPLADYCARSFNGHCINIVIVLGGVDRRGRDATNDLTYAILDAQLWTRTRADEIVIRVHKSSPQRFLMRALDISTELTGKIKWVGDDSFIPLLMKDGKTLEDARDYLIQGCFQPSVAGRSVDLPAGPMNTPLFVELALNRGVTRLSGLKLGPDTGDPREFKTFEDFWNAFKTQVEALAPHSGILKNTDWQLRMESQFETGASPLFQGCIESGLDIIENGNKPYTTHALLIGGPATTGDSIAAVKKVIFEDKTITMDRLLEALDHDFVGYEDVLNVMKRAPKFGNDDPYVDSIVQDVIDLVSDNITKYPSCAGIITTAAGAIVTSNVPLGAVLGATPDGRRAGTPISEGGVSPYQGTNTSGLTATLNSIAKLDHGKMTAGEVLNIKLSPALLKTPESRTRMANILRTFFNDGGVLIQFNIVDTETLIAAQQHPELYRDLLVRVSTYSSYFVELGKTLQDDIIARSQITTF